MMDQAKSVLVERAPSAPMQLYAALDNPQYSRRQDCTQFVMPQTDTLANAIDFINETIAQPLWGVSRVELVGIVSLDSLDNRDVTPRKVLTTFPLSRIFLPNHSDVLVVVSTESNNHQDDVHTDDSTDYPTSATGRFITDILDEDDDHDDDASHHDTSTSTDGDEITDHEDDDVITTDDEDLNTLPRHLLTAAGTISIADTETESTTPLTGLERAASADDETTEATTSPSSANVAAAAATAMATFEQQSDDVAAITPNKEEEVKTTDTSAAAHHVVFRPRWRTKVAAA